MNFSLKFWTSVKLIGLGLKLWQPKRSEKAARVISPITYLILAAMVALNMVKYYPFGIMTLNSVITMTVAGPMGGFISFLICWIIQGTLFMLKKSDIGCCDGSKSPLSGVDLSNKQKTTIAVEGLGSIW